MVLGSWAKYLMESSVIDHIPSLRLGLIEYYNNLLLKIKIELN